MIIRQNSARWFTAGRLGNSVKKIVIHHAATTDFDGIGRTFRGARQVSAHYGVGRNNNVDQYVPEASIAWHCGNWPVNCESIGIENVNETGAPEWRIADQTFETLVQLTYDIAKRHNLLPLEVGKNLIGHSDVVATACPKELKPRLQELADRVNALGKVTTSPALKSNEEVASEVIQGKYGNGEDRKRNLANAGYNYDTIQAIVNARLATGGAPAPAQRESATTIANQVIAGAWGNGDDRKARLERAGYSYAEVQAEVNRILGTHTKPSNDQIAREVIRGDWGNGQDRKNRLTQAGYNYLDVQMAVNRILG